MTIAIEFQSPALPGAGDLAVLVRDDLELPALLSQAAPEMQDLVRRAAGAERFKAKPASVMTVAVPAGLAVDRLLLVGIGKGGEVVDWRLLGGAIAGRSAGRACSVLVAAPDLAEPAEAAAAMALGARLRDYRFDRYKTKKKDDGEAGDESRGQVRFLLDDPAAARALDGRGAALAAGVNVARDLVNEPPNVLFPAEFARRAEQLSELGVAVEVFDGDKLKEVGMRALLAVGQGSRHGSRAAFMEWRGGAPDEPPLAIVGKGVCFDSGGISIKPAGGMEDMKGDMAGAATVVGLMHALAARQAKVNVVGAIGITENMPDGEAQRPGDIITTLSGQTVEMVNSDAEGRLVLGDVLWYVQDRYAPKLMIDLATLTGAILVALGQEHAGLFSNDDVLAGGLIDAGRSSGETVWRMPLGSGYDKLIDSKFADMKNTGGRHGGSVTAAQFLQRFVRDKLPWAHLDIAGTGMNAPQTEINRSWTSGWGVRLLDQFIRDAHETRPAT